MFLSLLTVDEVALSWGRFAPQYGFRCVGVYANYSLVVQVDVRMDVLKQHGVVVSLNTFNARTAS